MTDYVLNNFTIRDGKVVFIPEMPKIEPRADSALMSMKDYQSALQSAISNAVEVSNQEEVEEVLWDAHSPTHGWDFEPGKFYQLLCRVEKEVNCFEIWRPNIPDKGCSTQCKECAQRKPSTALVTFPESGEKKEETQEQLWLRTMDITGIYYSSSIAREKTIEELIKEFTITRK